MYTCDFLNKNTYQKRDSPEIMPNENNELPVALKKEDNSSQDYNDIIVKHVFLIVRSLVSLLLSLQY